MKTKILLVRNAKSASNESGIYSSESALSQSGKTMALFLGKNLQKFKIDSIYTSPKRNTLESTKIICKALRKDENDIKICQEFAQINLGEWEGLRDEEIARKYSKSWKEIWNNPDPRKLYIPNGETIAQVAQRAYIKLIKIVKLHKRQTILVVTHGLVIRALICKFLDFPLKNLWSFRIENASLSIAEVNVRTTPPKAVFEMIGCTK